MYQSIPALLAVATVSAQENPSSGATHSAELHIESSIDDEAVVRRTDASGGNLAREQTPKFPIPGLIGDLLAANASGDIAARNQILSNIFTADIAEVHGFVPHDPIARFFAATDPPALKTSFAEAFCDILESECDTHPSYFDHSTNVRVYPISSYLAAMLRRRFQRQLAIVQAVLFYLALLKPAAYFAYPKLQIFFDKLQHLLSSEDEPSFDITSQQPFTCTDTTFLDAFLPYLNCAVRVLTELLELFDSLAISTTFDWQHRNVVIETGSKISTMLPIQLFHSFVRRSSISEFDFGHSWGYIVEEIDHSVTQDDFAASIERIFSLRETEADSGGAAEHTSQSADSGGAAEHAYQPIDSGGAAEDAHRPAECGAARAATEHDFNLIDSGGAADNTPSSFDFRGAAERAYQPLDHEALMAECVEIWRLADEGEKLDALNHFRSGIFEYLRNSKISIRLAIKQLRDAGVPSVPRQTLHDLSTRRITVAAAMEPFLALAEQPGQPGPTTFVDNNQQRI